MCLENIKNEISNIIDSINNKENFNKNLDEFNLFFKKIFRRYSRNRWF